MKRGEYTDGVGVGGGCSEKGHRGEKEREGEDRWVRVPIARSSRRRLSFVSAALPNVGRPGSPALRTGGVKMDGGRNKKKVFD